MLQRENKNLKWASHYEIEGLINFYPDQHSLVNVKNGEKASLLSTASHCLEILIKMQGQIVSRKEMKDKVWGARGVIVSSNTFYQNMLNIRRNLEKVGLEHNIISTYYGKGVAISNDVKIVLKTSPPSHNNVYIDKYNIDNGNGFSFPFTESESSHIMKKGKVSYKLNFIRKTGTIMYVNIILALASLLLFYVDASIKRDNYFDYYIKSTHSVATCDIYIDPLHIDEKDLQKFLTKITPTCNDGESLYLSSVNLMKRISVTRCTGKFLSEAKCESDYYMY